MRATKVPLIMTSHGNLSNAIRYLEALKDEVGKNVRKSGVAIPPSIDTRERKPIVGPLGPGRFGKGCAIDVLEGFDVPLFPEDLLSALRYIQRVTSDIRKDVEGRRGVTGAESKRR